MATTIEIQNLKNNWLNDPCWDIEETEGFENHKEELKAYRLEWEEIWKNYLRIKSLTEKSQKMGIPDNLDLARYIEMLEDRIQSLENKL